MNRVCPFYQLHAIWQALFARMKPLFCTFMNTFSFGPGMYTVFESSLSLLFKNIVIRKQLNAMCFSCCQETRR